MQKLGTFILSFVIAFVIYILLVKTVTGPTLIVGLAVAVVAASASMRFIALPFKYISPVRVFFFLVYLPYFIFEVIRANVKIALVVLNPKLPISPELKKGKSKLKSSYGRLLLSSSITLTPGTLTVEGNEKEFVIHTVSEKRNAREIMEPFEKFIKRITE